MVQVWRSAGQGQILVHVDAAVERNEMAMATLARYSAEEKGCRNIEWRCDEWRGWLIMLTQMKIK